METFKQRQPANIPGLPVYAQYLLLLSSYGGWQTACSSITATFWTIVWNGRFGKKEKLINLPHSMESNMGFFIWKRKSIQKLKFWTEPLYSDVEKVSFISLKKYFQLTVYIFHFWNLKFYYIHPHQIEDKTIIPKSCFVFELFSKSFTPSISKIFYTIVSGRLFFLLYTHDFSFWSYKYLYMTERVRQTMERCMYMFILYFHH